MEFGDALGAHDCARSEEYLEVFNLDVVVCEGGVTGAEPSFIG